ncbi:unnamed protein product [Clonostachys rhizophaga]|uniref:Glucose-methanol-choline oxidoreductase N-terminal domain-containing protein n=1 Tax=Clonostachys rhizophaga TaxID=160324 RepID=A0A9N9VI84_9HYPO|nr:unnamed protein product [Clonostachys rhizophaga]
MIWDFIIVGGGLAGSVISNRLHGTLPQANILVVEAGLNANNDQSILYPNGTGSLSPYIWYIETPPQPFLNGRKLGMGQGTGLGGGTVVNGAIWTRGDHEDYDIWGETVGDDRWSYEGLLPYMKASEQFRSPDRNPGQHGFNGPVHAQTVTSTGRKYPLREPVLGSWQEIGYTPAPNFDGNSGSPIGIADVCENRNDGRRQIASVVYPLDGITVLTETFVQNILINGTGDLVVAEGIKLSNGTDIKAKHVVLSAGALRTPQLLMLSGVGPQDELQKYNIPVKVLSPDVGKNLIDHSIIDTNWKIKNPSQGWAPGSNNPLFQQPEFSLGQAQDFMVCDTVPRVGLIAAIAADEGAEPDESSHPLLRKDDRTFLELNLKYGYSKDGSSLNFQSYMMLSQTRGTVTLGSTNAKDFPIVDPKYFSTEVERYVHRQGLRAIFRLAGTDNTTLGRDILAGEVVPASQVPLRGDITDAELDQRLKAGIRAGLHFLGTASMGKVVDTNLKVNGVKGLFVADASIVPVPIAAHTQVVVYALAEQAAEIIAEQVVNSDDGDDDNDDDNGIDAGPGSGNKTPEPGRPKCRKRKSQGRKS